jgi:uncharacterized protein (UPF0297 family)
MAQTGAAPVTTVRGYIRWGDPAVARRSPGSRDAITTAAAGGTLQAWQVCSP